VGKDVPGRLVSQAVQAYVVRGDALRGLGRWEEALLCYHRVHDISEMGSPIIVTTSIDVAECLVHLRLFEEANLLLEKVIDTLGDLATAVIESRLKKHLDYSPQEIIVQSGELETRATKPCSRSSWGTGRVVMGTALGVMPRDQSLELSAPSHAAARRQADDRRT